MKKVLFIFFLIILYTIIITKKIDQAFIEKIDLNLKEHEMGITFISLDDSKSLLINKDQTKILVILEYLNSRKINDILKIFDVNKLDYILMSNDYSIDLKTDNCEIIVNKELEIADIEFKAIKNIIQIEYLEHNFCVYSGLNPTKLNNECHYVYFLNINKDVTINDSTDMIFYNEGTNSDFLEPVFDKWVDIYMIKKDYYVTLKLDEDTYDTITLPLTNNNIQTGKNKV